MWVMHALAAVGEAYLGAMLAIATTAAALAFAKRKMIATVAANRKKARGGG